MIYVYQNAAGERREIVASMKNPPPEWIVFGDNDNGRRDPQSWQPFDENWRQNGDNRTAFKRVYGDVAINEQKVTGKFGYYSRTLPLNIPGEQTNKMGQVLVRNKAHARELCKKTGFEQYD